MLTALFLGFLIEITSSLFSSSISLMQVDLFFSTPPNIPAESFEFYGVALADVAQAIVMKKPQLIEDADKMFSRLQQTKITRLATDYDSAMSSDREKDFALERGLCALLLGDLDKCRLWLGLDSATSPYRDSSVVEFVIENSTEENDEDFIPGLCRLLEAWLMEVVFPRFRNTEGIQFRLGDYYDDPTVLKYLERLEVGGMPPLAAAAAIVRIGAEATAVLDSVKTSAIQALKKVFPLDTREGRVGRNEQFAEDEFFSPSVKEGDQKSSDFDNSGLVDDTSPKKIVEELKDQVLMTERIKDVTVKIMSAGVAIGVLTLTFLKYVSATNRVLFPPEETRTGLTTEVVNLGTISLSISLSLTDRRTHFHAPICVAAILDVP